MDASTSPRQGTAIDARGFSRRNFLAALATCGILSGAALGCLKNTAFAEGKSTAAGTAASDVVGTAADSSAAADGIKSVDIPGSFDAADSFPVTITHAYGETVIEKAPERIATVEWSNHDAVLALGVAPVGCPKATWGIPAGGVLLPWVAEAYEKLGVEPVIFDESDGFDFEAVSDCTPDLILAPLGGMTEEDYKKLSDIAPVIPHIDDVWVTPWRDQITVTAEALGNKKAGEELVKKLEEQLAQMAAAHKVDGQKVSLFSVSATDLSKIYIYTDLDPRGAFLGDLGFKVADSIAARQTDNKSFYIEVSSEEADSLSDVDAIVCYGDEELVKTMQADPLLGRIPAIANGRVAALDSSTAIAGGVYATALSIPAIGDAYLTRIMAALAASK